MKKKSSPAIIYLAAFALWTTVVMWVDRTPIGPMQSVVGLASLNQAFHTITGVHLWLYQLTDLLSFIPFLIAGAFALMGAFQWVRRKKLRSVDHDILGLGIFYGAVIAIYLAFEVFVVNYRPILIDGILEASYPSSTTMLVLCVMCTAMIQVKHRVKNAAARQCLHNIMLSFTVFMVVGRLISGVHWLTDIVGGILLSAGLVSLYYENCKL